MKTKFAEKVYAVVRKIPQGATLTYKEVALRAGAPQAYRAVGNLLARNYNPRIPCHRVVRADGDTGGYNRGREKKKALLKKEFTMINPTRVTVTHRSSAFEGPLRGARPSPSPSKALLLCVAHFEMRGPLLRNGGVCGTIPLLC